VTQERELLVLDDLHVTVEDKEIIRGIDLTVLNGEVHALMGPNGSGKSTLANSLMGHPKYKITRGRILFRGEDVTEMPTDERARRGMFLAFQYPASIPGVTMVNFLRTAVNAVRSEEVPIREFRRLLMEKLALLQWDEAFVRRYVNEGFSGGEKKKAEVLQLALLAPKLAIMDETDSGLDIDALRIVSEGVNSIGRENPDMGALVITHYQRMLNYIRPDKVHVLVAGRIVRSGGAELSHELEAEGYEPILRELAQGVS
jgi:Fe-S cluster assembly ATP-binding protein